MGRWELSHRLSADIGWSALPYISGLLSRFLSCGYPQSICIQVYWRRFFLFLSFFFFPPLSGRRYCMKQTVFLPESLVKWHWVPISFGYHIPLHREKKSHMNNSTEPKKHYSPLFFFLSFFFLIFFLFLFSFFWKLFMDMLDKAVYNYSVKQKTIQGR